MKELMGVDEYATRQRKIFTPGTLVWYLSANASDFRPRARLAIITKTKSDRKVTVHFEVDGTLSTAEVHPDRCYRLTKNAQRELESAKHRLEMKVCKCDFEYRYV